MGSSNDRMWLVRADYGAWSSCWSPHPPTKIARGMCKGMWSRPNSGEAVGYWKSYTPGPDGTVCGQRLQPGGGPVDVTEWSEAQKAKA